jgi:hypothetical protein
MIIAKHKIIYLVKVVSYHSQPFSYTHMPVNHELNCRH